MRLPNLFTPRLLLCEFTLDDFTALREIEGDPEILRFRTRSSISEAATRQFLEDCLRIQNEQPREKYPWAIVLQNDHFLVGQVGLTLLPAEELEAGHSPGLVAFLWGSVNRRYWNQGIMSEALAAVIAYGFRQIGLQSIRGRSQVENIGSWRALEKAGLHRVGLFQGGDPRSAQYDYILTKAEFESQQQRDTGG